MINQPLVSIIIPTYNRQHIISETLDSISNQTYLNWECLIIDDCSTDGTDALLQTYIEKDTRFMYYQRPQNRSKGANACRNLGLEKANGDYVIFFDSDDLMRENHIETKVNAILKYQSDYVITQTQFFNYPKGNALLETNYDFENSDITAYNYITQNINWLTFDTCIKSAIAKSICFNEELQAGQEYNYFSKLTLKSTNTIYLKEVVTLRRHHENSIRGQLSNNKTAIYESFLKTYWCTYLDTYKEASQKIRTHLVYKCTMLAYKMPRTELSHNIQFYKAILKTLNLKGVYHVMNLMFRSKKSKH